MQDYCPNSHRASHHRRLHALANHNRRDTLNHYYNHHHHSCTTIEKEELVGLREQGLLWSILITIILLLSPQIRTQEEVEVEA